MYFVHKTSIEMTQIFRRADPAGRTIGEFVREELSDKVGDADVFVGLPESGADLNPQCG